MDRAEAMQRLGSSMVARLATADIEGRPHIVPITFAVDGDTIFFAVDHKPKRTTNLRRLRNIAANPHVAVMVDHYEDRWDLLWWVRADGSARVLDAVSDIDRAITLLSERYHQYRARRPTGPVVTISIERVTGWSAT